MPPRCAAWQGRAAALCAGPLLPRGVPAEEAQEATTAVQSPEPAWPAAGAGVPAGEAHAAPLQGGGHRAADHRALLQLRDHLESVHL